MKLYTHPLSPNCRKVYAVAKRLNLELAHETVDLLAGKQREPAFAALNPNQKVPVLVDGETTLWESNAICCYLAAKTDNPLWPKSYARYGIISWMFWEANHLSKPVSKIIGQKIFSRDNPDAAIIAAGLEDFRKCAQVLERTLADRKYLTGDELTLADYSAGVWLGYETICELPIAEFSNIQRWWQGLSDTTAGKLLLPPQ